MRAILVIVMMMKKTFNDFPGGEREVWVRIC